jgi:hypothetical protein
MTNANECKNDDKCIYREIIFKFTLFTQILYILNGTSKITVFTWIWDNPAYKMDAPSQSSIFRKTCTQNMFNFVYGY